MPRQCRVKLRLPDDSGSNVVQFNCNLVKDHDDGDHSETGRVRTTDNRVIQYTIEWHDSNPEVWRG